MSVRIKICGLKTPEALDVALAAGADLVGFVFFPASPRHVGFEAARALGEQVRGRAQKVALSAPIRNACGLAVQSAFARQAAVQGSGVCVRTTQEDWIVSLAPEVL